MDITQGMQLSKGHQPRTKIKSHIGNFASEIIYISPEFLKGSCQECFLSAFQHMQRDQFRYPF